MKVDSTLSITFMSNGRMFFVAIIVAHSIWHNCLQPSTNGGGPGMIGRLKSKSGHRTFVIRTCARITSVYIMIIQLSEQPDKEPRNIAY